MSHYVVDPASYCGSRLYQPSHTSLRQMISLLPGYSNLTRDYVSVQHLIPRTYHHLTWELMRINGGRDDGFIYLQVTDPQTGVVISSRQIQSETSGRVEFVYDDPTVYVQTVCPNNVVIVDEVWEEEQPDDFYIMRNGRLVRISH